MEQTISKMESWLTKKDKKVITSMPEAEFALNECIFLPSNIKKTDDIPVAVRFSFNNDTTLINYFDDLGIKQQYNIEKIVLTSLHRKLSKKEIDLEEQIRGPREEELTFTNYVENTYRQATENYNRYQIGDRITILMERSDFSDEETDGPEFHGETDDEFEYDPERDLKITGVITNKYTLTYNDDYHFDILIEKATQEGFFAYQNRKIETGETYQFSLWGLTILE